MVGRSLYNENRILYRKEIINGEEIYIFSNNPDDELYSVTFTLVGDNQGDYELSSSNAINNIYEYVVPINGIPQGNYAPVVQLVAPTLLQIAVINGEYAPSEKTNVSFELAGSKNDLNLFSNLDDENNNGYAGKLTVQQSIIKQDSLWNLNAIADIDYINQDFKTIQRLYRPEFNRDWNLSQNSTNLQNTTLGNQALISAGFEAFHPEKGNASYNFQHLNYSGTFIGSKHNLNTNLRLKKLNISYNISNGKI